MATLKIVFGLVFCFIFFEPGFSLQCTQSLSKDVHLKTNQVTCPKSTNACLKGTIKATVGQRTYTVFAQACGTLRDVSNCESEACQIIEEWLKKRGTTASAIQSCKMECCQTNLCNSAVQSSINVMFPFAMIITVLAFTHWF